jgi:hypothetical protein
MMCSARLDPPVAGAGEPVSLLLAGGGFQRRGAVPGREVVPAGEPVDIAGVGEQPGCAGGADAVQLEKRGTPGLDEGQDFFLAGLDLAVDAFQLADQLGDQPPADPAGDVTWPYGRDQRAGLRRGQELSWRRQGSGPALAGGSG